MAESIWKKTYSYRILDERWGEVVVFKTAGEMEIEDMIARLVYAERRSYKAAEEAVRLRAMELKLDAYDTGRLLRLLDHAMAERARDDGAGDCF